MLSRFRNPTKVFVLALAICTMPAFAEPWFFGEFRSPSDQSSGPQMAVVCRVGERCTVTMATAGGPPKPVGIPIQAPPKPLDPVIANNNLDITRKAAADKPDWYSHASFGPVLRPLRPVLEAGVRFAECADLDGTAYMALCSLSSDPAAAKATMLLVTTMNPTCGTLPFCAYYFVPLDRIAAR